MAELVKNITFTSGKGLDVFSNPHSMPATQFTAALGVAINRPDYGYPGPGYSPSAFISDSVVSANFSAVYNYGIGALALSPPQNQDVIVPWWGGVNVNSSAADLPPGVTLPSSLTGALPTQSPLYPWRQKTERAQATGPVSVVANGNNWMASAPMFCSNGVLEVMGWQIVNAPLAGTGFAACYRAVGSDAWSQPYMFVTSTFQTTGNPTIAPSMYSICMSNSKFYLFTCNTSTGVAGIYQGSALASANPLTSVTTLSTGWGSIANLTQIDCAAVGNEAAFIGLANSTTSLYRNVIGDNGTASTVNLVDNACLSGTPIGLSAIPTPPTFTGTPLPQAFALAYIKASNVGFSLFTSANGVLGGGAIKTVTGMTGGNLVYSTIAANHSARQISIGVNKAVVGNGQNLTNTFVNLNLAIEYKPNTAYSLTPTATTAVAVATYNSVLFFQVFGVAIAAASTVSGVNAVMRSAWGGLALAGKWANFQWGPNKYTGLIQLRSGWNHLDGNGRFGTPIAPASAPRANPNLFYYDDAGFNLVARAGDSDVGQPNNNPQSPFWPPMSDATNYAPNTYSLGRLSSPMYQTLTDGRVSVSWPWAQLAQFDTISATINYSDPNTSSVGTPLAYQYFCSPAVTTFYAPTASEPIAPMQQYGTELAIPGALPSWFDGTNAFEMGFLQRTPTPVWGLASTGSLTTLATYYICAVGVYVDAQGREHKAAPSDIVGVTLTGSFTSLYVNVPYMKQTYRGVNGNLQFVRFDIYQSVGFTAATAFSNITFYKTIVSQAGMLSGGGNPSIVVNNAQPIQGASPAASDMIGVPTSSYRVGNMTDAQLQTMPQLYTTGLPANASAGYTAPPPFDAIAVWNSRLWGLTSRNGNELWYTDLPDGRVSNPSAPNWSNGNVLQLPADVGIPRAIIGLDAQLVCMGNRADYGLQGDGPPNGSTGLDNSANSPFAFTIQLPSASGIQVLNGVCRIPTGILYQGAEGLTLLDRSLQYHDVGTPVDPFTGANLYLAGVLFPAMSAALLYCATDPSKNLMYFYNENTWSQQEQPPAGLAPGTQASAIVGSCAVTIAGQRVVLTLPGTGNYYQQVQNYSQYMSWRTPWIELAPQANNGEAMYPTGMGTLREVQVLGDLTSPIAHTLTLYTEFDYANNTAQPPNTQTLTFTGQSSQPSPDYQWRFGLPTNNVRRVRFTLTFSQQPGSTTPPTSAPVLFSGLVLSYFSEDGQSRLGANGSTGF